MRCHCWNSGPPCRGRAGHRPGLAARRARTLPSWTSAVVNSPTGGPELAQIVTVRDIGEEAQIAHLELTDQARAIVGHELVLTAIHKAARHGNPPDSGSGWLAGWGEECASPPRDVSCHTELRARVGRSAADLAVGNSNGGMRFPGCGDCRGQSLLLVTTSTSCRSPGVEPSSHSSPRAPQH
jgi:hypothetical protein